MSKCKKEKRYNRFMYQLFIKHKLISLIKRTNDVRVLIDIRDNLNKEINKRNNHNGKDRY